MKQEMTANEIVSMLLGGDDNHILGVIVDNNTITYLSELEDGYDDKEQPIISAYENEDSQDPIFECSLNELSNATISNTRGVVVVNIPTEIYGTVCITPLMAVVELN